MIMTMIRKHKNFKNYILIILKIYICCFILQEWKKQKCTFEGGVHYFHKDFKQKDSIPISISYLDWNGKIAGFSWQHYAKKPLEGTKWTTPDANKALPISPSLASTYNQGII